MKATIIGCCAACVLSTGIVIATENAPVVSRSNPAAETARAKLRDLETEYDLRITTASRCADQRDYVEATKVCQELESFAATSFGESHWRTTNARLCKVGYKVMPEYIADSDGLVREEKLRSDLKAAQIKGDKRSCATLRDELLHLATNWFGKKSVKYLEIIDFLIQCADASGDKFAVEALYEEYSSVADEIYGNSAYAAVIHARYGNWLYERNDFHAALLVLRKVYTRLHECSDRDNADLANLIGGLAQCELCAGDPKSAKSLYEEALRLVEEIQGCENRNFCFCIVGVALSSRMLGDNESALRDFRRAHQLAMELAPDIVTIVKISSLLAMQENLQGNADTAKELLLENEARINELSDDAQKECIDTLGRFACVCVHVGYLDYPKKFLPSCEQTLRNSAMDKRDQLDMIVAHLALLETLEGDKAMARVHMQHFSFQSCVEHTQTCVTVHRVRAELRRLDRDEEGYEREMSLAKQLEPCLLR